MGAFFGSFFTLAVYRLPLKKNITYERSFCPNCNHKLGAFDLVPVFSYIFLGGKCRYCKEKIKIRYLLLEVLSGLVFVLAYLSYNMEYPFLIGIRTINLIDFIIMYIFLAILAGIDKERMIVQKNVLMVGFCANLIYNTYLYYGLNLQNVLEVNINIILSIVALVIYGIYLHISNEREFKIIEKGLDKKVDPKLIIKKEKIGYTLDILMILLYVALHTNLSIILAVIIGLVFFVVLLKIMKKEKIPMAFIICILTVILNLCHNVYIFF
jgi:leader peptidase (prepilin peptidase)/N-methyltransferase